MKKSKVTKPKKTLKRLDRVEELLSKVMDQHSTDRSGLRELIDSARASIVRAKAQVKASAKAQPESKSPAKATSRKASKNARVKAKGKTPPKRTVKSRSVPRSTSPARKVSPAAGRPGADLAVAAHAADQPN